MTNSGVGKGFRSRDELVPVLHRARAHRLAHGLVLEGPSGIGATTAALRVARALLCTGQDSTADACGVCADCRLGVGHPDLHLVQPDEDARVLGVERIRELGATLERMSVQGRARVAVIEPAERLTEQAQNALLKTLEEPGQATWLLLTSARPESLLPTVHSRVQRLRLRPWAETELVEWLAEVRPDVPTDRRAFAAKAADGRPGRAAELCSDGEQQKIDGILGVWLAGLSASGSRRPARDLVAELLEGGTGGVEAERKALQVLGLLRERLAAGLRGDLAGSQTAAYAPARIEAWASALDATLDASDDVELRIPPGQVLTSVLLRVEECVGSRAPVRIRVPHGPLGR